MFTKKLTEWTAKNDRSEADIEEFFQKNSFIFSFFEKNSFNGFLIDYEFLLLKKNFIKKLQSEEKVNIFWNNKRSKRKKIL